MESLATGLWHNAGTTLLETQTANVLNKLPQALQAKAKANLNEISLAESRAGAEQAFDHFLLSYEAKYPLSVWPKIGLSVDLLWFSGRALAAHQDQEPD